MGSHEARVDVELTEDMSMVRYYLMMVIRISLFLSTTLDISTSLSNWEYSSDADPVQAPEGKESGEIGLVKAMKEHGKVGEEWWGFKLVLSYPRREMGWEPVKRMGDVEGLKGGAQLIVELVEPFSAKGKEKARKSEDNEKVDDEYDGYDTEESE